MTRLSDRLVAGILLIFALFMYAGNQSTSNLFYGLIIVAHALFVFSDKQVSFPFERSSETRVQGLLMAIGAYLAYIILIPGAIVAVLGLKELFINMGMLEATQLMLPQLGLPDAILFSPWTAIVASILYGAAETLFFFGSWLELVKDELFGDNWKAYLISWGSFLMFHIWIKRSVDITTGINAGLVATAVFAGISVWLVYKNRQTIEATELHMINNGVAEYMKQFGAKTIQKIIGG